MEILFTSKKSGHIYSNFFSSEAMGLHKNQRLCSWRLREGECRCDVNEYMA